MRREATAPLLVALVALAVRLGPVLSGGGLRELQGYDDGVHLAAAQVVLSGSLPYVDVVFLHPPGVIVLMLPFAALGEVVGTDVALATARATLMAVGAVNAGLVAHLLRRFGRAPQLVGGGCYAVWAAAAVAERTVLLEPLLNLALLVSLLLLDGGRTARRTAAAGAVLGVGCGLKIWPALLAAAVLLVLLVVERTRAAAWAGGVLAGGVLWGVPTLAVGGAAVVEQVLTTQAGRDRRVALVDRLVAFDGTAWLPSSAPLTAAATTARACGVVAVLLVLLAAGVHLRLHVWTAVTVGAWLEVVVLAPSFYAHYTTYAAPGAALLAGAASSLVLRPRLAAPATAALAATGVALTVGATTDVPVPPLPQPELAAFGATHRCVWSNSPTALLVADLRSDRRAGCPQLVDGLGTRLAEGRRERDRTAIRQLAGSDAALVLPDRLAGWNVSAQVQDYLEAHFEPDPAARVAPLRAWTRRE